MVTIASGYLFVKAEKARPGPPAPPPVSLGPVSWPAAGVSAADISGIGVVAGPGADRMVPIASVAKVMTAYVILRDHPLSAGGPGPDNFQHNLRVADEVRQIAAEAGATPAQVALAWLLAQGDGIAPIPGTKRVSRLEENVAADSVQLTAEQLAKLDQITLPAGEHHNEAQMRLLDR